MVGAKLNYCAALTWPMFCYSNSVSRYITLYISNLTTMSSPRTGLPGLVGALSVNTALRAAPGDTRIRRFEA